MDDNTVNPATVALGGRQDARPPRGERIFARLFDTLVYNHVWEDPEVDLEALQLTPEHHLLCIASAGCNLLAYLAKGPASIQAVDINRHHLALARLKVAALKYLPSHEEFFRFFAAGNTAENIAAFEQYLYPQLDAETRAYWAQRSWPWRPRITMFSDDFYRHGLLSRFVDVVHLAARLRGRNFRRLVEARTKSEQRRVFEEEIAPVFDGRLLKFLMKSQTALFALGIPPAQYRRLCQDSGDIVALLRRRVERLACDFPIDDNYFAWQVFARQYDLEHRKAIPLYLKTNIYSSIRSRTDRVQFHHTSLTRFLADRPAQSLHRFVLLDSQDWMSDRDLVELWTQIDRTAAADARVIFRTAAGASPVSAVPQEIQSRWTHERTLGERLHVRDRASIYGGFHLYIRNK